MLSVNLVHAMASASCLLSCWLWRRKSDAYRLAAPGRKAGFARRGRVVFGVRGMVLLRAGCVHTGNGSPSACAGAVPTVAKRTRVRRRTALGVGVAGEAAEAAQEEALFTIYAHPSDLNAQAAAERLRQALSSTTASSRDDARAAFTAVLLQEPSNCPGCGIYFDAGGQVELLASGESAGKGLKSELPKVLMDLCSRQGCRP